MVRRVFRVTLVVAALAVAWNLCLDGTSQAGGFGRTSPGLFSNYYVAPGPYGGVGPQLYVAPVPTPASVGHTHVTYQPLMPHEFLYRHHRSYYRYNQGSGWTRTMVSWQ